MIAHTTKELVERRREEKRWRLEDDQTAAVEDVLWRLFRASSKVEELWFKAVKERMGK